VERENLARNEKRGQQRLPRVCKGGARQVQRTGGSGGIRLGVDWGGERGIQRKYDALQRRTTREGCFAERNSGTYWSRSGRTPDARYVRNEEIHR